MGLLSLRGRDGEERHDGGFKRGIIWTAGWTETAQSPVLGNQKLQGAESHWGRVTRGGVTLCLVTAMFRLKKTPLHKSMELYDFNVD